LAAAGKENIKSHQKEHNFAKIEEPEQIFSFRSLLAEYQRQKSEESQSELLAQFEQKKNLEEERIAELEIKKRQIEAQMEEERKKHKEREAQLEKERLKLLEKQKSFTQDKSKEEKVIIDGLAPLREQANVVNRFEQKLEALQSMGFIDRETNIQLLLRHNGEIFPVIQDLLN